MKEFYWKIKICLYENNFSHLTGILFSWNRDLALVGRFSPIKTFRPILQGYFCLSACVIFLKIAAKHSTKINKNRSQINELAD